MERKRILIAVNAPPEIEKLRKMLVTSGYEVKISDNGTAALSLSRSFRPHLILSELNLTKIDGHHLLREVKSHSATKAIPFVLMSRHRSVDERVHSISLGADDYITLPLDVREVMLRFEIILKEIEKLEPGPRNETKGFSGKLSDMNLVDLLQTLEIGKKSCVIRLENDEHEGAVFLKDGEVVDVVFNDLSRTQALFRMFTWAEGSFKVEFRPVEHAGEFEESTEALVAKGLSYRDRWDEISKHLPPLQTAVKLGANVPNGSLSNEEKSLIRVLNGKTKMGDLVTSSGFDDLVALRLVAELYKKGILEQVPLNETEEKRAAQEIDGGNGSPDGSHFSGLISNFLHPKTKSPKQRTLERRRTDRRSSYDRRLRARRWEDFIAEKNRIYLNKSELIMIREKLANRKK